MIKERLIFEVQQVQQHSLSEANRHLRQAYHRVMVKLKTTGWIFFQDFFQSAISIAHKNFRNLRGACLFPTRQNSTVMVGTFGLHSVAH